MSEGLSQNSISSNQIYAGGNYSKITAEELKGNLLAIRQLINNYNEKVEKLEAIEEELADSKGELEFQNTYQYIAIVAAIFNVIGTILCGIGINQISSYPTSNSSYCIIILGGLTIATANIAVICYKKVRKWFNK